MVEAGRGDRAVAGVGVAGSACGSGERAVGRSRPKGGGKDRVLAKAGEGCGRVREPPWDLVVVM